MSVGGFRVRMAGADDLAECCAWSGLLRRLRIGPRRSMRRWFVLMEMLVRCEAVSVVAEVRSRLVGFAVGKVIGLGRGVRRSWRVWRWRRRRGGAGWEGACAGRSWSGAGGRVRRRWSWRFGRAVAGAIALYAGLGFVVVGRRTGVLSGPGGRCCADAAGVSGSSGQVIHFAGPRGSVIAFSPFGVRCCLLLEVLPHANRQVH